MVPSFNHRWQSRVSILSSSKMESPKERMDLIPMPPGKSKVGGITLFLRRGYVRHVFLTRDLKEP